MMAGNHAPLQRNHHRWVLIAFVALVCWTTMMAWRPNQTLEQQSGSGGVSGDAYMASRQAMLERLQDASRTPLYRWLTPRGEQRVYASAFGAQQERAKRWATAIDARAAERLSCMADASTLDARTAGGEVFASAERLRSLTADELLLPVRSERALLAQAVRQLNLSHPAWQLISPPHVAWWREAPVAAKQVWQAGTRYASHEELAAKSASPALLLNPLLLAEPSVRLAMVPRHMHTLRPVTAARQWDARVLDAVRPYLASSADNAFDLELLPEPEALVAMLQSLALEPHCTDWASQSLATLAQVGEGGQQGLSTTGELLSQLAHLSQRAEDLAVATSDAGLATRLRRARYAMWRRVQVWRAATALVTPRPGHFTLASAAVDVASRGTVATGSASRVPVDELLAQLEAHESTPSPASCERLAQQVAQLAQSTDPRRQALADAVYVHYANANARVAITDELLTRLLPPSSPQVQPVRERVLGTPVRGQATTRSAASVTLLPDDSAWRIGLEVAGQVDSQTVAFERTVRVHTTGSTQFAACQQILVDGNGVRLGPVAADADSQNRLLRASSQYDVLPVVGGLVRARAASAFSERRTRAERVVAKRTSARVEQQVDQRVRDAVMRAERKWQTRFADHLEASDVVIEPVEMLTTPERLVARVRIAHPEGLAAHTPRPRAPSDSLASLQLHETGLSNLTAGLRLAGERLTAEQFSQRLLEYAPAGTEHQVDDEAESTIIEFAERNPVTFTLADGKVHVTWHIRELVVRQRASRNFKVHVYYTPSADGLAATFHHAAGPYFEGQLRNIERMRLQAIFGKVFPEGGEFTVGERYASDERLQGLAITQLVIDDGWLGLALGPQTAHRTAQLDRYAPLQ